MHKERWLRVKEVFFAATELPQPERAAFLARECAGDAMLAAEVQSLLDEHDHAGDFLEAAPAELPPAAFEASPATGERIGPYRLAEPIGSGGMGDVYRAERDDAEYRAEVAIKLMRADMRHPLAAQRFRTERQILAALDHRNIARLLDGGTTPGGLPYVVMELVRGEPIDRYAQAQAMGPRERVQLFLQVCAAVSYAHQHLVVHRDLKPGNILVTPDGSVKLLDFGIAKLLEPQGPGTEPVEETRTQLRAMTLEYASPEQVSGGTVTTASDVYALGVVLYRLLTGQSPYRATGSEAARVAEIIGDTTPVRPSAAGATLLQGLERDLDHVLLKALRKEPAHRYASVEQFAADLRNVLEGRPVSARRGTFGYRASRFIRRNRVAIAASVLVAASIAVGFGMALREARIAERERAVAQRHFDSVRQLANTLLFDLYADIVDLPGAMTARAKLAQTGLGYLDELAREAGDDAELNLDLAGAYRKLGDIQGGQNGSSAGDSQLALASYAKSDALVERVLAIDPANERATLDLARGQVLQARVLLTTAGPAAALAPAERAVKLVESLREGSAPDYDAAQVTTIAWWTLGDVLTAQQKMAGAMDAYERMLAVSEAFVAGNPQDIAGLKMLRNAYNNAGIAIDPRLTPEQALQRTVELMRKSLAVSDQLLAREPDSPEHVTRLAEQRYNLADTLFNAGDYDGAIELYRQARPAIERAATDTADARANLAKAMLEAGLAGALARTGNNAEAAPLFDSAESALRGLLQRDTGNITTRFVLAQVEIFRGAMLVEQAAALAEPQRARLQKQARASLEAGVARMRAVDAQYTLAGGERAVLDAGIAALARASQHQSAGNR